VRNFIHRNYKYLLFFFLFSLVLNVIFFHKLKEGEFLFIGDAFLKFSLFQISKSAFHIKKIVNFHSHNSWQFMTEFWDSIYFLVVYTLTNSLIFAQRFRYFLVIFLSLSFSFAGFYNVNKLFGCKAEKNLLAIISVWYIFNPYTLTLFHGGVYNIGSGLTYSLSPLILYFFHLVFFNDPQDFKLKDVMALAALLFFASFTFWLVAPLLFFLLVYFVVNALKSLSKASITEYALSITKKTLAFCAIYIPLVLPIIYSLIFELINTAEYNNPFASPTFGSQQGGIWYQIMLIFSWGIYTKWYPRHLYSFGDFFFSPVYVAATVSIYIIIAFGIFRSLLKSAARAKPAKQKQIGTFVITLLIFLFFAKAAQPPFGGVFLFLYEKVTLFRVFRSADARFGFTVVLSLSLLFISISKYINKYFFSLALLGIVFVHNMHMFNGDAIYGQEVPGKYFDRITHVPKHMAELAEYLNNTDTQETGYILPLPTRAYGHFLVEQTDAQSEHFVGQDILRNIVHRPFVFVFETSGIKLETFQRLNRAIAEKDYREISEFPIKYILVRKDVLCKSCQIESYEGIEDVFQKAFENEYYKLFEVFPRKALVESHNADVEFEYINPTKVLVRVRNLNDVDLLNLYLSHDPNWRLYINKLGENADFCSHGKVYKHQFSNECVSTQQRPVLTDISFLFKKSTGTASKVDYYNTWNINSEEVTSGSGEDKFETNSDGSVNFEATLFYKPQAYLMLFLVISGISLLGGVIVYRKLK
jgi:hypothetical protein